MRNYHRYYRSADTTIPVESDLPITDQTFTDGINLFRNEGCTHIGGDLRSDDTEYLNTCLNCPIVNLCQHCAAHAVLETGRMDGAIANFCEVAHARAAAIEGVNPV